MGILMLENGVYPLLQQPLYHLSESRENSPRKFVVQTCRYLTRIHILHCYFSWQDETHLCHKTNLYPYISSSLFFYFFFLFSNAFFCSLANLRSTFFTSSAAGRFSGTMPRCTSISRTAALLAICSWLIRLSP